MYLGRKSDVSNIENVHYQNLLDEKLGENRRFGLAQGPNIQHEYTKSLSSTPTPSTSISPSVSTNQEKEEPEYAKEEENSNCNIGEISSKLNPRHIWQIAVPHSGTTTLEKVFKSAVQQDFKTRFYNNTKVCPLCSVEEFEYKSSINSTRTSGRHADWYKSNKEFQNVNEVCRVYGFLSVF